jgi:hypothetical protein
MSRLTYIRVALIKESFKEKEATFISADVYIMEIVFRMFDQPEIERLSFVRYTPH